MNRAKASLKEWLFAILLSEGCRRNVSGEKMSTESPSLRSFSTEVSRTTLRSEILGRIWKFFALCRTSAEVTPSVELHSKVVCFVGDSLKATRPVWLRTQIVGNWRPLNSLDAPIECSFEWKIDNLLSHNEYCFFDRTWYLKKEGAKCINRVETSIRDEIDILLIVTSNIILIILFRLCAMLWDGGFIYWVWKSNSWGFFERKYSRSNRNLICH